MALIALPGNRAILTIKDDGLEKVDAVMMLHPLRRASV